MLSTGFGCLIPTREAPAGSLGGGCARWPAGTYLYLHAVGVGNRHVAVLGLARWGAKRSTNSCDTRD
jgi:hypothetical protein